MRRTVVALALLMTASKFCLAQADQPFSAERPGFTNGTETVPPGQLQFEFAYLYQNGDGTWTNRIGDSGQFRVPLNRQMEVRLGVPAYQQQRSSGRLQSGMDNLLISSKWRFQEETKHSPALALISGSTLPTGSTDVGNRFWQPQASLEASHSLGDRFGLQVSGIYQGAGGEGRRFDGYGAGLNLGMNLTPITSTFFEVFYLAPGGGDPRATFVDGGLTWTLNNRLQFDINGGLRASPHSGKDYFVGAGIVTRWHR